MATPTTTTTSATQADRDRAQAQAQERNDPEKNALARLKKYISADLIRARFEEMMNSNDAGAFINSVVLAVANGSDQLKECTPESVVGSALRAATLRLSCDPALKQAHLVPYKDKATLVIHYQGYVDLALRTNRYTDINVSEIYEGEEVVVDRITGHANLAGGKKSNDIIGWLAYLKMTNGFSKVLYMTKAQIHDHAKKYSKSYWNEKGLWQKDPEVMERKTALRMLMIQWGAFSPSERAVMRADDEVPGDIPIPEETQNSKVIDGVAKNIPEDNAEKPAKSEPAEPSEPEYVPVTEPPEPPINQDKLLERPLAPVTLRAFLAARSKAVGIFKASDEQRGLMIAMMEMVFAPDPSSDKIRRSCIRFLFNLDSSKKMTGPQVKATLDWLNPTKDSGGALFPDSMAARELMGVWEAEQLAKGQTTLPGMEGKK